MTKRSLPKYLLNYISKFKKKKKKNTFKLQTNSTKTTTCNTIHDNNCNDHDLFSKTPKFEDIIPSDRFFTSPATTGSLMEEARLSVTSEMSCGGVAVVVYTCDPSCEFRQSMQEMVSSRDIDQVHWEFMQELLLCYLQLNDQSVHKQRLEEPVQTMKRSLEFIEPERDKPSSP
ncbi:Ovate protein family C-terminal protein [Dioscorea alata]|uniref:Ovate protein family C-terminal protein n=1 Tax=Dioscorea alata TaxID=55571 RepID=A0ACB7UAM6_DIOAL|nr:Ovate protein family C-terminal protein [Dioscorea alata]